MPSQSDGHSGWFSYLPALIALAIGLGISTLAAIVVQQNETERLHREIDRRVENHTRALEYGLNERVRLIEELRVLFGVSGKISPDTSSLVFKRHLGRVDFSWSKAKVLVWVQGASNDGLDNALSNSCQPEKTCGQVLREYPLAGKIWRSALAQAGRKGKTLAVALPKERPGQEGMLGIIAPLLHSETRVVRGYMVGIFSFPGLVEEILGAQTAPSGLDAYFFKGNRQNPGKLFHFHGSRSVQESQARELMGGLPQNAEFYREFLIADQAWSVVFSPVVEVATNLKSNEALWVFISGLLITVTISGYLVFNLRRTKGIEKLVALRTRALDDARDRAEKADLAKSKFLAAASHDLRQPLQAMNLFVNVLSKRNKDGKSEEVFKHLKEAMGALEGLLNALLNISKLEAGLIVPDMAAFHLGEVFNRLEGEFNPLFQNAGLELRVITPPWSVHSDPVLLERILRNLLANALRYTEKGRVLLAAKRQGLFLKVGVWDRGIGIAEDQLELVFGEFYQVARNEDDDGEGVGLGLAIVSRLAHLLGHDIQVSSTPGAGSVFTVAVPLIELEQELFPSAEAKKGVPQEFSLVGKRVLVIDDEEKVRIAMAYQLEGWEAEVITAASIEEALAQADKKIPDLIIADYRLRKGETGYKAIKALRKGLKENIPAILVTGDTAPKRLQKAQKSGLKLLHKPVSSEQLLAAIQAELF